MLLPLSLNTTTALLFLFSTTLTTAIPTASSSSSAKNPLRRATTTTNIKKTRHETQELYPLHPQSPNLPSGPPVSYLDIQSYSNASQRESLAAFRGFPRLTKEQNCTCSFGWTQGDRSTRLFLIDYGDSSSSSSSPSAQMSARPLVGFTTSSPPQKSGGDGQQQGEESEKKKKKKGITYQQVHSYDANITEEEELTPDFTYWDAVEQEWDHPAGNIPCDGWGQGKGEGGNGREEKEEDGEAVVWIKLGMLNTGADAGDAHVFMDVGIEGDGSGLYVEYQCQE